MHDDMQVTNINKVAHARVSTFVGVNANYNPNVLKDRLCIIHVLVIIYTVF